MLCLGVNCEKFSLFYITSRISITDKKMHVSSKLPAMKQLINKSF